MAAYTTDSASSPIARTMRDAVRFGIPSVLHTTLRYVPLPRWGLQHCSDRTMGKARGTSPQSDGNARLQREIRCFSVKRVELRHPNTSLFSIPVFPFPLSLTESLAGGWTSDPTSCVIRQKLGIRQKLVTGQCALLVRSIALALEVSVSPVPYTQHVPTKNITATTC
ncbi:hypothetical protein VTK56DRAFT_3103 [Thermocarpiscus australiensis]